MNKIRLSCGCSFVRFFKSKTFCQKIKDFIEKLLKIKFFFFHHEKNSDDYVFLFFRCKNEPKLKKQQLSVFGDREREKEREKNSHLSI